MSSQVSKAALEAAVDAAVMRERKLWLASGNGHDGNKYKQQLDQAQATIVELNAKIWVLENRLLYIKETLNGDYDGEHDDA